MINSLYKHEVCTVTDESTFKSYSKSISSSNLSINSCLVSGSIPVSMSASVPDSPSSSFSPSPPGFSSPTTASPFISGSQATTEVSLIHPSQSSISETATAFPSPSPPTLDQGRNSEKNPFYSTSDIYASGLHKLRAHTQNSFSEYKRGTGNFTTANSQIGASTVSVTCPVSDKNALARISNTQSLSSCKATNIHHNIKNHTSNISSPASFSFVSSSVALKANTKRHHSLLCTGNSSPQTTPLRTISLPTNSRHFDSHKSSSARSSPTRTMTGQRAFYSAFTSKLGFGNDGMSTNTLPKPSSPRTGFFDYEIDLDLDRSVRDSRVELNRLKRRKISKLQSDRVHSSDFDSQKAIASTALTSVSSRRSSETEIPSSSTTTYLHIVSNTSSTAGTYEEPKLLLQQPRSGKSSKTLLWNEEDSVETTSLSVYEDQKLEENVYNEIQDLEQEGEIEFLFQKVDLTESDDTPSYIS